MNNGKPDAEELVVKAQFFIPIEPKEKNLRNIQNRLAQILMEEGFYTEDAPMPYMRTDRTMEFIRIPPSPESSGWQKIKKRFGFGDDNPHQILRERENFLEGLGRLVEDTPFRIVLRFKTFQGDEIEGYEVFVESTPAILQQYRQLDIPSDYNYNIDNIVRQNKSEIKRIFGRLELEATQGPYTEAESLDTRLSESIVNKLNEHQYGQTAVQYVNEGNQCLKQNLLHAALSCYILGIEWLILHYRATEENEDLVKQQQKGEIGPVYFDDLVDKIREDAAASQKTMNKLEKFHKAERRWMAHHKSGELQRQDVENVRSTLLQLSEELS